MSYRSTLPMAKNRELFKYYTEAVEHLKEYKKALEEAITEISSLDDIDELNTWAKIGYYKAKVELHEVTGKINAQENNKQVYQDRIELMMPEFEKLSAEANVEFEKLIEDAITLAKANPTNRYVQTIGMILQGWNSIKDEKLESAVKQELKNETYKSLKTQMEAVKQDKGKLKKA